MSTRGAPIEYKVLAHVAEVPPRSVATPYERMFRAITSAPKDKPVTRLQCTTEADAEKLAKRLHALFSGKGMSVRRHPGSRIVHVRPAKARVPRVKVKGQKKRQKPRR